VRNGPSRSNEARLRANSSIVRILALDSPPVVKADECSDAATRRGLGFALESHACLAGELAKQQKFQRDEAVEFDVPAL